MIGKAPTVYNIPADTSFVDALAEGILIQAGADPMELAGMVVLLPTRRATRSLQEAFLRQRPGAALFLPRMIPLGDLDEDELLIAGIDENLDSIAKIPPAISGLRRQLLLTRLVMAFQPGHGSPDQAAQLAVELARLVDQVQTERLSFDRLTDLVPEDYAAHWQVTLDFLTILTEQWPLILAEEGCLDPSLHRNGLLEARAKAWCRDPPNHPIFAAGSTGSIPATADLLAIVANLPQGCVILPGFDAAMADEVRAQLEPAHPQYGMSQLLGRLEVKSDQIRNWPSAATGLRNSARAKLLAEALCPASTTDRWRDLDPVEAAACDGISLASFSGQDEEARGISLMMREAVETSGKTAALVTPDRRLARRVGAELRRWDIAVDDSAGSPLALTPPGNFLRLTAEMTAARCTPISLLGVCKHPLAGGGRDPAQFRYLTRRLEEKLLRGPRPAPGLAPLRKALPPDELELNAFLADLDEKITPFMNTLADPASRLKNLIESHILMAEALAASATEAGANRLWRDEAGESAAAFMVELLDSAEILDAVEGVNYPALLNALMQGRVIRPRHGRHPRLFIWGLLEARLQHADLMILGGLNEGTWPPEVQADPWMSRPMRLAFGLPLPERRIGLAAHDFVQAMSAAKVILTRAERVDGVPTVPARWLVRLEKLLLGASELGLFLPTGAWQSWQTQLDAPARFTPSPPPAPRPPVSARPRRLSVTQVETWMRDPYAIYARHILGLRALDPIDAPPDAAEYGTRVHKAIDLFIAAYPADIPNEAAAELMAIGRDVFDTALHHPAVWAFWWPRFERIAAWFVEHEVTQRDQIQTSISEAAGELILRLPTGEFCLTAVADRIDRFGDGTIRIVDYKTGAIPSRKEVVAGFAPQLPLEAAIAAAGGFSAVGEVPVSALEYWRLRGTEPAGEVRDFGGDVGGLVKAAFEGLRALAWSFDHAETPYEARPRSDVAPRYSDYEHLARVKEWASIYGNTAT